MLSKETNHVLTNYNVLIVSDQYNSNIAWIYFFNSPVVKIVIEVTITNHEFEFFEEFFILVNVESIKHIVSLFLGLNQCITHQISSSIFAWYVVE